MARPGLKLGANLFCHLCGREYYAPPSRAKRSRFCSKECADSAQTGERRVIRCTTCGEEFSAAKDHGVWPKFCSNKCRVFGAPQPTEKRCPSCESVFLAARSSHESYDGLRIFCSNKCRVDGLKVGTMRQCLNCGQDFYINNAAARQRNEASCCSDKCGREFYTEERSKGWRGGKYLDVTQNMVRVMLKRAGFVSPYIGEHRVVASRAVGRMLLPHEKILHIDNDTTNNIPDNLFICGTNSEMQRRVQGSLPWPTQSNLDTYR